MLDDLVGQLVGEAMFGRLSRSRKAQLIVRLFFGLLGTALGVTGAMYFATRADLTANPALRAMMAGTFVFLACFSMFNVAFRRPWRWPGLLFIASFVAMFVVRIAFGP
jgi:hypothetical protein